MTSPPPNIILTGFMGTGKTAAGRLVADHLSLRFIDTDAEIALAANATIPELFARSEDLFRQYERVICLQCALGHDQVIATGGGALLQPNIRMVFEASGMVICLTATLEAIMERVGHDPDRPLFGDREAVARLLDERRPVYDSLPYHVDTSGKSPSAVSEEVIDLWNLAR